MTAVATITRTNQEVPIEALRFAADFKPTPGEDSRTPFTALARTANPIAHWYWGQQTVHDFAGMKAAEKIAVDWNHNANECLGFVDKMLVTGDGLSVSGYLLPMVEGDLASQVAFKSAAGVPYQASIYFDPNSMVVEDLPEGFSTRVNGKQLIGPATIFRQWTLLGLAVCLYGVDAGTRIAISKLSGKVGNVSRFTTPTDTATARGSVPGPPAPVVPSSRVEQSRQYLEAFGDVHGPILFAKHDKFPDAQAEYFYIVRDESRKTRQRAR